jgi:hypothetical protein
VLSGEACKGGGCTSTKSRQVAGAPRAGLDCNLWRLTSDATTPAPTCSESLAGAPPT